MMVFYAMAVENGKRRLKLASKTIIESKRNYRLHGSTILTLSHVNVHSSLHPQSSWITQARQLAKLVMKL